MSVTVSCRVMARSSQNLVIIVKNVRHQYFLYLVCSKHCSVILFRRWPEKSSQAIRIRTNGLKKDILLGRFAMKAHLVEHDSTSPCRLQMDPDRACLWNHHRPMQGHCLSGRTRWALHTADTLHPLSPWCPPD